MYICIANACFKVFVKYIVDVFERRFLHPKANIGSMPLLRNIHTKPSSVLQKIFMNIRCLKKYTLKFLQNVLHLLLNIVHVEL
jgi:hypothetical protein